MDKEKLTMILRNVSLFAAVSTAGTLLILYVSSFGTKKSADISIADLSQPGDAETIQKTAAEVPLPTKEDAVRLFFALINENRIQEALEMMTPELLGDESSQQAWAVQFNDIKSINVLDIKEQSEDVYKVTLEAYVSSRAANAPIPYYGWGDNPNVRWVYLNKDGLKWKIDVIATSP